MINEIHLAILRQGGQTWNHWRNEHAMTHPHLDGADLRYTNLRCARLSRAHLRRANLSHTNLSRASLRYASLGEADLSSADLRRARMSRARLNDAKLSYSNLTSTYLTNADLRGADLSGADLTFTYLTNANLRGANLADANLTVADLRGANLHKAHLGSADLQETIVEGCSMGSTVLTQIDLSMVIGLETIRHGGPSILDLETVILPLGSARELFLRGVGIRETMIEYYDAIYTQPIQFHSCFISYTQADYLMAKQLYDDLQRVGIRCWFSPHDLQPGDYYRKRIDRAIQLQDKLILLLSQQSIASGWVEYEVTQALAREGEENRIILFPLRLDELVMHTSQPWARAIRRSRHIGDLTCWKDEQAYQQVLTQIIKDLKVPVICNDVDCK